MIKIDWSLLSDVDTSSLRTYLQRIKDRAYLHPETIATSRLMLKRGILPDYNVIYTLYLKNSDIRIGFIKIHADGEIWYVIDNVEYQKQGFMREAMNAVLKASPFDEFYLIIRSENVASITLAHKLGFVEKIDASTPYPDLFCKPLHRKFSYQKNPNHHI